MPDSKSEDSLRGYDMVVSVSEDAINKQFQYLWETPIPSRLMPRPSSLTGYDKLSPAKYYINHDLKIYPMLERPYESLPVERRPKDRPTNGVVPVRSPYGIEGHILAPTVSFRGEKRGDNVDFRCVRITFKFVRDETAPEGLQDSIIRYHDAFLGDQKKSINGCTVTWLADISSANIEDYMGGKLHHYSIPACSTTQTLLYTTDLVKASTDTNLPTLLPQGVIAKLESVDPRKFLASSLFCLFEKNEILNSFDLVNPNAPLAHPDGSPAEDPILPAMAAQIAMYFNKLSKLPPGRPTPDNPFVLGYGIIAKVPPVSAADNNRAANTPYFVPKLFHLTVTPGANGFTKGTLNYCIMTHRAQGIPEDTVDIKDDSGLGIFKQTLFETSRSNGTSGGADGVMAFSKKIFSDFWLQSEIATNFKIDPYALSPYLLPKNDPVAQAPAVAAFKSDTETKSRGCTIRTEFTYDPMQCKPMAIDEALNNMVPEDIRNEIKKTLPNFYLYLQQRAAKGKACRTLSRINE